MALNGITITDEDIQEILRQANPGEPAALKGDACEIFREHYDSAIIGTQILTCVYPDAGAAVAAMIAIAKKICSEEFGEK